MRWRCNAESCGSFPKGFEFIDNGGVCPKCNRQGPSKYVVALIDVHLVVMDSKGPILGGEGRQYVACMPTREYLCRNPYEPFSASGHPLAVTCPKCQRSKEFRERAVVYAELAQLLDSPAKTTAVMGGG